MGRRAHREHQPTRRRVLALAAASFATVIVGGCGNEQAPTERAARGTAMLSSPPLGAQPSTPPTVATVATMPPATTVPTPPEPGRLLARPLRLAPSADVQRGWQLLGIAPERDALLYVPPSYTPERPIPLVLSLHGAGGDAEGGLPCSSHLQMPPI